MRHILREREAAHEVAHVVGQHEQGKALVSQGTSVLNRLQNTNEVKPGHSGTAYCYLETTPLLSGVKQITVTSTETHQTRVMTKQ